MTDILTPAEVTFSPGQRVTWYHVLNGGYNFEQAIPAIVVGHKGKRVKIAVLRADGHTVVIRHVTPERLHAIHAWTAPYPYADKGYCLLCGEIDGHKDVDWPLGVHESGETEHAILPCPIGLLETKHD